MNHKISAAIRVRVATFRYRLQELRWWLQVLPACVIAQVQSMWSSGSYHLLNAEEVRATRKSNTVFIFGSGSSLNTVSSEGWREIESHDTFSLRDFPRQSFVRTDYHMTGEVDDLEAYARRLRENPLYERAIFLIQSGFRARNGNFLIGRRLLTRGSRVFRYRRASRGEIRLPSENIRWGVVHGPNSIVSAVNMAYLLGWKRIVLVGVDLNNKRYFWLEGDAIRPEEKSEINVNDPFESGAQIRDIFALWAPYMRERGVELLVYNPQSLLAGTIPVFQTPYRNSQKAQF